MEKPYETERLILRCFTDGDAQALYENHLDNEVRTWFPNECYADAGEALEALAVRGRSEARLGCSLEAGDLTCHLSGAETKVQEWIRKAEISREDIAREIYDLLARTIVRMLRAGSRETGITRALVTGGVASSPLLRQRSA